MFHQSGTLNSTSGNIFPSHGTAQQHIISSTHAQYGNKPGGPGEMQPQKWLHTSTSTSIDSSTLKRSRRKGPLRPVVKTRAAAVRKKGACFRCAALKEGCEDVRPCTRCKNLLQPSKRAKRLSWMKCDVYTVSTHSIYISDACVPESPMPTYIHTVTSMLEQVRMPPDLQTLDLDLLATKYAGWISHAKSDTPTSKFVILCSSDFQSIASQGLSEGLSDNFIQDFRFLLWATSLYYTAVDWMNQSNDATTYTVAFCNLEKLIALRGKGVTGHLDELCHPERIKDMPPAQCKLLFLIIIGLCLSASYVSEKSERIPVSPDVIPLYSYKIAWEQSRSFIAALANIAAYIGHLHGLFPPNINYSAIVDAAHRRWDNSGSYTLQIPSALSKKLTEELLAHKPPDAVSATMSPRLAHQDQLIPGCSTTQVQGSQERTENALTHQQARNNECSECLQSLRLCALCEFLDYPDGPDIDTLSEAPLLIEDIAIESHGDTLSNPGSCKVDISMLETQLASPSNSYGASTVHTRMGYTNSEPRSLWYCCECSDGPHLSAIEVACCLCEHRICDACRLEQYDHRRWIG